MLTNVIVSIVAGSNGLLLPSDWMHIDGALSLNKEDNMHYQCSFRSNAEHLIRKDEYKSPRNGDCRDLFNLNLVYMVVQAIALHQEKQ